MRLFRHTAELLVWAVILVGSGNLAIGALTVAFSRNWSISSTVLILLPVGILCGVVLTLVCYRARRLFRRA